MSRKGVMLELRLRPQQFSPAPRRGPRPAPGFATNHVRPVPPAHAPISSAPYRPRPTQTPPQPAALLPGPAPAARPALSASRKPRPLRRLRPGLDSSALPPGHGAPSSGSNAVGAPRPLLVRAARPRRGVGVGEMGGSARSSSPQASLFARLLYVRGMGWESGLRLLLLAHPDPMRDLEPRAPQLWPTGTVGMGWPVVSCWGSRFTPFPVPYGSTNRCVGTSRRWIPKDLISFDASEQVSCLSVPRWCPRRPGSPSEFLVLDRSPAPTLAQPWRRQPC